MTRIRAAGESVKWWVARGVRWSLVRMCVGEAPVEARALAALGLWELLSDTAD
ncbi:MAG: hypothetical protein WEE64_00460 [Dehalococcoidia bacterium]